MRPIIFLLLMILVPNAISGQNLIQNPGFEDGAIPTTQDQVSFATGWSKNCGRSWLNTNPNGPGNPGSPDLFDTRSPNCMYQIPSNKWGVRGVRANGVRYVGFTGVSNADGPQWFGETVEGTLTSPLLAITYQVSFWVSAIVAGHGECTLPLKYFPASPENKIEVVLRKGNNCAMGKSIYVSPSITSPNWQQFTGQFTLSAADAAVGYDRIEFRLVQFQATGGASPFTHAVFFDDVELTQQVPTLPCCKCLGEVVTLDLSTGQGGGAIDPFWEVDGHPAYITPPDSSWLTLTPAQWLQPVASPLPSYNIPNGSFYRYRMKFIVPSCTIPRDVRLEGRVAGDNTAAVLLNSLSSPVGLCNGPDCYKSPQGPVSFGVGVPYVSFPYVLSVVVRNTTGPSGMIMNAQLRAQCKKE